MRQIRLYFFVVAGAFLVGCSGQDGKNGLAGSQGPQGPLGPQGPQGLQGPAGEDWQAWAYVGNNDATCRTCHADKVSAWRVTGHPQAFQSVIATGSVENPYCLQCHTLGWDAPVAFGDSTLTEHGLDNSGYDDFWPAADVDDTARLQALQGVQCESCHSAMGPGMYEHSPVVSLATRFENGASMSPCAACHDTQLAQWHAGGHGNYYERTGLTVEDYTDEWGRTSCWTCHSAEGFIAAQDPDFAGATPGATIDLVGCVACHDPHGSGNVDQLRTLADQAVSYNPNTPALFFTGRGSSQICAHCHHARRSASEVENQVHGTDPATSSLRGPHASPQMDMFLGTGCYEIAGRSYLREPMPNAGHKTIGDGDGCVACHMVLTISPVSGAAIRDHSLRPDTDICQDCHPGLVTFNFNNFQTRLTEKLTAFETYFAEHHVQVVHVGDPETPVPLDSLSNAHWVVNNMSDVEREAFYAYLFVKLDGSLGVHNPSYANSLLVNGWNALNGQ